jgi:hypothetical protein
VLIERLREVAAANDRSLSAELRIALDDYTRRELPKARKTAARRESEP